MRVRFAILIGLVLVAGFATKAFGQDIQYPLEDNRPITRAGAVALLIESHPVLKQRLQHHIRISHPLPLFDDVQSGEWYGPYVETAFEAGIVSGNKSRLFRPGDNLREEEAIALMTRYAMLMSPSIKAELASVTPEAWLQGYIGIASRNGVHLPFPIRMGESLKRTDLYTMLTSVGVQSPEKIVVTHKGVAPAVVLTRAPQPIPRTPTPRPSTVDRPVSEVPPQPQQPVAQPPVVSPQPVQQAPSTVQPSTKPFSITLPTLGITDLTITHPSDPFTKDGLHAVLKYGVGHLFSYPGKGGKILIYGHSSSYPWDVSSYTKIFRQINKLSIGDKIYVTHGGTLHTYEVSSKQTVPANDMSVYSQGGGEELILYTCWPPDSIAQRYLVHAKRI